MLLAACDRAVPETQPTNTAETISCTIPDDLTAASRATPPDNRPDAPTAGYVLALSWSPEYCRFREDSVRDRGQCRDNRFGLVVHGLWPQAARGPHPRSCAPASPVPEYVLREHYCMSPSAKLMQDEWAKHGTCQWDSPDAYFDAAADLWGGLAQPDLFTLSRDDALTAGAIRAAFRQANPDVPAETIGIDLNRRGWLDEIKLCMDTDFQPRACQPREYGASDGKRASIWRGG
ncbi:MAG: ribonuclease T [Pacificimonas sp.]